MEIESHGVSRRALLLATGAMACGLRLAAASPAANRRWIDVHHHFVAPALREFYAAAVLPDGSQAPKPPLSWEVSADLDDMDRSGVDKAILSNFVPYDLGTSDSRASLAREINDYGARLVSDHRGRFAAFAALPLPNVDRSLRELDYALGQLGCPGVAVYTNCGDCWLGDERFEALHAEFNHRKAVVFVHPTSANCCRGLVANVSDNVIEYGTDTTRAIASLVFGGVTTRYPDIQFIFAHGGGTMPYLIERFLGNTSAQIVPGIDTSGQTGPYAPQQPPGGVLAHLRRFHYDTAQCSNPVAMGALRKLVPASQILYGTDYYYRTSVQTAAALASCGVFGAHDLQDVGRRNALRLIPTLKN
jgi:predicted TIM-barrel fold metal-dependent hydrolase